MSEDAHGLFENELLNKVKLTRSNVVTMMGEVFCNQMGCVQIILADGKMIHPQDEILSLIGGPKKGTTGQIVRIEITHLGTEKVLYET